MQLMRLHLKKGYSQEELNQIISQYNVPTVAQLTQLQGAEVINKLQNLSKKVNLKKRWLKFLQNSSF